MIGVEKTASASVGPKMTNTFNVEVVVIACWQTVWLYIFGQKMFLMANWLPACISKLVFDFPRHYLNTQL